MKEYMHEWMQVLMDEVVKCLADGMGFAMLLFMLVLVIAMFAISAVPFWVAWSCWQDQKNISRCYEGRK